MFNYLFPPLIVPLVSSSVSSLNLFSQSLTLIPSCNKSRIMVQDQAPSPPLVPSSSSTSDPDTDSSSGSSTAFSFPSPIPFTLALPTLAQPMEEPAPPVVDLPYHPPHPGNLPHKEGET